MPEFKTDEIYWYNPEGSPWGRLGFACPNFGNNPIGLNQDILYLVKVMGRNLQAVMLHGDRNLQRPPSINTLTRIHKLIVRARSIISTRVVPEGKPKFEAIHATPAPQPFMIYPCPFWEVRNYWLQEYGGLALAALSEMMQHTDVGMQHEFGPDFAGTISQYLQRVYKRMATELFGLPLADAEKPDFTLTDAQLAAYNPSKVVTSTEMIDVTPIVPTDFPTEDDLVVLTNGIPATQIAGLQRWPAGMAPSVAGGVAAGAAYAGSPPTAGAASTGSFAPPPGP